MAKDRTRAREIARSHLEKGDSKGWFEELYREAARNPDAVPWADLAPNPHLTSWLQNNPLDGTGKKALVVGCGLGDDAEKLASLGFTVTAFDISGEAIQWARQRFPESPVDYQAVDLFQAPASWHQAFDFIFEAYTLQVMPPDLRLQGIAMVGGFVAPGGRLLIVARGREPEEDRGSMPWPLTKDDLSYFAEAGLEEVVFEDYLDNETPPARRFRVQYRRPQ